MLTNRIVKRETIRETLDIGVVVSTRIESRLESWVILDRKEDDNNEQIDAIGDSVCRILSANIVYN